MSREPHPTQAQTGKVGLEGSEPPWLSSSAQFQRLALRWTFGNASDAQDLLSDAVLRAIEGRERAREVGDLRAWFVTVISNLGRDRRRAGASTRAAPSTFLQEGELAAPVLPPIDALILKYELRNVGDAVSRLPTAQRQAVLLRCRGEPYERIAKELGWSTSNARKQVQLARKALRAALDESG